MESIPSVNNKMQLDDLKAIVKVDYFDGLGRPLQTVQKSFTPLKKNLLTLREYDEYNRPLKEWMPIAVELPYMGENDFKSASQLFYSNESRAYTENKYSTEILTENVLSDELAGIQAPGADMNNHYASHKMLPNEANKIKCYTTNSNMLQKTDYYSAKTLLYEQQTDEDGRVIRTYKNKQGQVVMTQQSSNHDTYYVYNDLEQLTYVLPPLASDALSSNTNYSDSHDALIKYAYLYKYDNRGNCIYKRLPGCGAIHMVYDKSDRLILSQDGNQCKIKRNENMQWTAIKYDVFGRVIFTGTMYRSEIDSLNNYQTIRDIFENDLVVDNYSSNGFNACTPLTENYYDNYNFIGSQSALNFVAKTEYDVQHSSAKGLLTGTHTYLLDGSGEYTTTAYYYDYKGQVVQTRSTNHLGGYDFVYNQYDFTGNVTQNLKEHTIAGQDLDHALTELYEYTYDHALRPTMTTYKLNNKAPVVLAVNQYDELGRLVEKKRHNNTDTEQFEYNIRNWTTKIKSGTFEQNLYYNSSPYDNIAAIPSFNGNISATTWTYNGNLNGHLFHYDALNRLTTNYAIVNNQFSDLLMSENFWYDKQGNIIALSRFDNQDSMDYLQITYNGNQLKKVTDGGISQGLYSIKEYQDIVDVTTEFVYDNNGNIIADLDRDIVTIKYNLLNLPDMIQFKNGSQILNKYDASGQKLSTRYLSVCPGLYQPLNQGEILENLDVDTDEYVTVRGVDYDGNIEYHVDRYFNWNEPLQPIEEKYISYVHNPEGYATSSTTSFGPIYYYNRKDHLGNNREVWRASYTIGSYTYAASTSQRTQYYPSGLPWKTNSGDNPSSQPYKYNGKEFVEMHGLDEYDSKARWYYPAIMRTTTMDPLAEKYYNISPYAWCGNNPVKFVDLDGREIEIEHRTGLLGLGKKQLLKYDNGIFYNKDGSTYAGKVKGFLKNTSDALGSLSKTHEGAAIVTELQSSSNVFKIQSASTNGFKANSLTKAGANLKEVQASTGNTDGSEGSGGTIFWNHSSTSGGFDLSGGTIRPNYISLGHEMGHGSDSNQGLLHYSYDYTNVMNGVQYQSTYNGLLKSEWRAVYRENLIRGQAGVHLRTNYGIDMSTGIPLPSGPRLLDSSNLPINYP